MQKKSILPCFKYIGRNLSTPEERYEYAKNFFLTMEKQHVSEDEYMLLYCSNKYPQNVGEPLTFNGIKLTSSDYREHILSLEYINSSTCQKYYKSNPLYSQSNNLCQVCPTSKAYKNSNYDIECSILKYIISSKDNYDNFSKVGNHAYFKSVYDVATDLQVTFPAICPILSIAYTVISENQDCYDIETLSDRLESLVGKITVAASYNENIKKIQALNYKALPVAWSKTCSDILSSAEINYEEICRYISAIDIKSSKPKKKKNKEPNRLFEMIESMDDSVSENSAMLQQNNDNEQEYESDNDTYIVQDDPSWYQDEQPTEANTKTTSPEITSEEMAKPVISSDDSENNNAPVKTSYRVPPKNDNTMLFSLKVNSHTLKTYASSYTKNENEIFQSVLASKMLPIEVIFNEDNTAYLIMFVRNHGRFYWCKVDNNIPNTLLALLTSKSVKKICYQPYYLYSLLRVYGKKMTNVYSLCTMDRLLHPDAVLCLYDDFFKLYTMDFVEAEVGSGFEDFDSLIANMQRYIQICASQMRGAYDKSEYERRSCIDEVLGTSFLRIINLTTNDCLFDLRADGQFEYTTSYESAARHDGFFITYSIGIDDIPDLQRERIYIDSLVELCKKGRIFKYNIQLVALAPTSMVLFIGEEEYELISTLLQKYFNKYALVNKIERFELTVAHQRIYKNTKKKAKTYILPSTFDEAIDMFLTTSTHIQVEDSRIINRKKKTKDVRKSQHQKFIP